MQHRTVPVRLVAMDELDGRTVVITGAGSGIGRAFAEGFLADGATVVGTDIIADRLRPLEESGAITSLADVSDDAQVRETIDLAVQRTGRVDVLVNNAGYGSRTNVEDLGDGEFERMIAVHVFGMIYGMRAALPVMRAQNHGRIINIVSRAAEMPQPGNTAYGAAKAAMYAATRSAALEVGDADILINAQFPGMTNTAIWGTDMPGMQDPEAAYPTARMLATLPPGGPTGQCFYREQPYEMFGDNLEQLAADREEIRQRLQDKGLA